MIESRMKEIEKVETSGLSYDTKTIITILLLVFVYPVGIIMMFVWMKWPWWVKLLCLLFFILPALIILSILGVVAAAMLISINPKAQIAKAQEVKWRSDAEFVVRAINDYYIENSKTPWGGSVKTEYKTGDVAREKWLNTLVEKNYLMPSFKLNEEIKYRLEAAAGMGDIKMCFESQVNKGQEVCNEAK